MAVSSIYAEDHHEHGGASLQKREWRSARWHAAIAYNLIRLVMLRAASAQRVPLDRISFIDALRWLRDADEDTNLTPLVVNPARPNRLEPRVIKRRKDKYCVMTKPRDVLRKALLSKKDAA